MATVDDAFAIAQSLTPAERCQLIDRLWDTIPPQGLPQDFKPSEADLVEVKRRWAEYEAGRMKAVPWEEVRDDIRRIIRSHD